MAVSQEGHKAAKTEQNGGHLPDLSSPRFFFRRLSHFPHYYSTKSIAAWGADYFAFWARGIKCVALNATLCVVDCMNYI